MVKMPARRISWDYVVSLCKELARRIRDSGYKPDVVVAIARGGFVPARLLCDYLGVVDLLSIKVEHWVETGKAEKEAVLKYPFRYDLKGKRVLIVDDICDTGESFMVALEHVRACGPAEVRTAAMQLIPETSKFTPDYYVEALKSWEWQLYPWCDFEDKSNLIRRIMREEGRDEWTPEELAAKFREYYGVDFSPRELEEALEYMAWAGMVRREDRGGRRVYRLP